MAVSNLVKMQQEDHAKRMIDFASDAVEAARNTFIDEEDHSKGYVNIRVGKLSGQLSTLVFFECAVFQ